MEAAVRWGRWRTVADDGNGVALAREAALLESHRHAQRRRDRRGRVALPSRKSTPTSVERRRGLGCLGDGGLAGGRLRAHGAKGVVLRLGALREAGETAVLAQRGHAAAAAREDLVGVDLVRHIKDDRVRRRVKHVVQRDGQLDHTQRGAEVAARLRHRVDRLPPARAAPASKLLQSSSSKQGCARSAEAAANQGAGERTGARARAA